MRVAVAHFTKRLAEPCRAARGRPPTQIHRSDPASPPRSQRPRVTAATHRFSCFRNRGPARSRPRAAWCARRAQLRHVARARRGVAPHRLPRRRRGGRAARPPPASASAGPGRAGADGAPASAPRARGRRGQSLGQAFLCCGEHQMQNTVKCYLDATVLRARVRVVENVLTAPRRLALARHSASSPRAPRAPRPRRPRRAARRAAPGSARGTRAPAGSTAAASRAAAARGRRRGRAALVGGRRRRWRRTAAAAARRRQPKASRDRRALVRLEAVLVHAEEQHRVVGASTAPSGRGRRRRGRRARKRRRAARRAPRRRRPTA